MIIFLYLLIGVFVIVFALILAFGINNWVNNKVKANSSYYKQILELNKKIEFYEIDKEILTKTFLFLTEKDFKNFNVLLNTAWYIQTNKYKFNKLVEEIYKNRTLQGEYGKELSKIHHTKKAEIIEHIGISEKSLIKRETKISRDIIKTACTNVELSIKQEYTDNFRIHYEALHKFSFDDIEHMLVQPIDWESIIIETKYQNMNGRQLISEYVRLRSKSKKNMMLVGKDGITVESMSKTKYNLTINDIPDLDD